MEEYEELLCYEEASLMECIENAPLQLEHPQYCTVYGHPSHANFTTAKRE